MDAQGLPTRRAGSTLRFRLAAAGLVLLVLSVVGVLPVQMIRVGAGSMAPTLGAGDLVVIVRWPSSVDRWDVVVAEPAGPGSDRLVKRVVALGGESVAIEDGVLVVEGTPVCEPWSDPADQDGVWFGPVRVPDGEVFLLGDDRGDSIDSRAFGPVGEDRIAGRVVAGAWPLRGSVATTPC
jgi:signal peptidase I